MSARRSDRCLNCDESRGAVRDNGIICCSVDYFGEVDQEFGNHRWKPWTDSELSRMGIPPEAYEKYRTEPVATLPYAPERVLSVGGAS